MIDLYTPLSDIVSNYQFAVFTGQGTKTSIQALAQYFLSIVFVIQRVIRTKSRQISRIKGIFSTPSGTKVLKKHELCGDIAELSRSFDIDLSNFVQATIHALEGFVSEIIRDIAAFAVEIRDKPVAKREILRAVGVGAVVEPREKASERSLARFPSRVNSLADAGFHHELSLIGDVSIVF
ncbi:MAG: hypothetical protein ABL984_10095 [Pyrinomonadaceae bacterium]